MTAARAFYGHDDETCVLQLTGAVRFVTAKALRRFVDEVVAKDPRGDSVVVDLRRLETIDSTGLGLLARVGRATLRRGRRAVIVCPDNDVATCLRSAAFDELFAMTDTYPFDETPTFAEVPIAPLGSGADASIGNVILDAHRDLASLSEANLEAYRDVIAALEADLRATTSNGPQSNGTAKGGLSSS